MYVEAATEQDAFLFWQDGVVALLKHQPLFCASRAPLYVLQQDIEARNLNFNNAEIINIISLKALIELTEQYYPQFAL